MAKRNQARAETGNEKSFVKGLSFNDFEPLADGNPAVVDVKNGKIVRLRPLHYDAQYDMKKARPWKIEARGLPRHRKATRHSVVNTWRINVN